LNRVFFKNFREWGDMERQNGYFESKVEIPRIKHGKGQTLKTLINEEALLFAKSLKSEQQTWIPRVPSLTGIERSNSYSSWGICCVTKSIR
jgi:hypothetical protein